MSLEKDVKYTACQEKDSCGYAVRCGNIYLICGRDICYKRLPVLVIDSDSIVASLGLVSEERVLN